MLASAPQATRDVILLNNDTLVPPGWIERLAEAAYSASDIGTATPLSNDATVFSYPREDGANPVPDEAATIRLDRLARRANARPRWWMCRQRTASASISGATA